MKKKLGEGGQGTIYLGIWHCERAAFKASEVVEADGEKDTMSAMKKVTEMQEKMREVYELIDLQKKAKKEEKEAKYKLKLNDVKKSKSNIERVLFPLAHFRQITDRRTFDVYVYPECLSDLAKYLKNNQLNGAGLRETCIQMTERKVSIKILVNRSYLAFHGNFLILMTIIEPFKVFNFYLINKQNIMTSNLKIIW